MTTWFSKKYFFILRLLPTCTLLLSGCGGSQQTLLRSKTGGTSTPANGDAISSLKPGEVPNLVLDLAPSPASLNLSGANVNYWSDSLQSSTQWTSTVSSLVEAVNATPPSLSLKTGAQMTGYGRLPDHLGNQFTFVWVSSLWSDGATFRFGVDDHTDAMSIDTAAGGIQLRHESSPGALHQRSYAATTGLSVYAAVFGETSRDMEFYKNGVRDINYITTSTGAAAAYQTVARDFKISYTGAGANLAMGRFLVYKSKLSPQKIYALTKYLGGVFGATVPATVSSEIISDTMPPIEPENVDSTYVFASILTPKCLSCHGTAGISTTKFATNASLQSAQNTSGQPLLVPGNPTTSRLYQSLVNNSMPFGGSPLTDVQKETIRAWIANGAP